MPPLTCLQDQQWQIGAVKGSSDFGIWAVKILALHKQCEVSVKIESFAMVARSGRIQCMHFTWELGVLFKMHTRPIRLGRHSVIG